MARGQHWRSPKNEIVSQSWCSTEMSMRIPSVSDGRGDNMISADKYISFYKNCCYVIVGGKKPFFFVVSLVLLLGRGCSVLIHIEATSPESSYIPHFS